MNPFHKDKLTLQLTEGYVKCACHILGIAADNYWVGEADRDCDPVLGLRQSVLRKGAPATLLSVAGASS